MKHLKESWVEIEIKVEGSSLWRERVGRRGGLGGILKCSHIRFKHFRDDGSTELFITFWYLFLKFNMHKKDPTTIFDSLMLTITQNVNYTWITFTTLESKIFKLFWLISYECEVQVDADSIQYTVNRLYMVRNMATLQSETKWSLSSNNQEGLFMGDYDQPATTTSTTLQISLKVWSALLTENHYFYCVRLVCVCVYTGSGV